MRLLKPGRQQRGWSMEFECTGHGNRGGGCGAMLLVEKDDVFITESHAMGETDRYNTFKCSECGVLTDLPRSVHLPFTARKRAEGE